MSYAWERPTVDGTPVDEIDERRGWNRPTINERDPLPFEETQLYQDWRRHVYLGKPNDMFIVITPSSRTGVSGSGKTTAETALAKSFDFSEVGFDADEKGTVDIAELAYEILPTVTLGSAVAADESQGLPGTDSLNSRRGMKTSSIDAINAILAARDGRITLIMVVQQLSMLDSSVYPLIDAWLLIRREPDDPGGPLMTHHKVHTDDYDLKNPKLRTPAVEDLTWPRLPHDDPDYQAMQRKKHEGKQRGGANGESEDGPSIPGSLAEMPPEHRDPLIKDLRRNHGVGRDDLADAAGVSPQRISQIAPIES